MKIQDSVWEAGADAYAASAAASPLPSRLLDALAGECIADLGCGHGSASKALAPRCGLLVEIDLSAPLLAFAPHGPGITRCRATLARLPVRDGAFDGLYSFLVWPHLSEQDSEDAWREAARVLKPRARFLLGLANRRSFFTPLRALMERVGWYSLVSCRHAEPVGIGREARRHGFRVIEIVALAKPVTGSSVWTRTGASMAARMDRTFAKILPWWGGDLVVLLERNP